MTGFALVLLLCGESYILDYGLTYEDCAARLDPAEPLACEIDA